MFNNITCLLTKLSTIISSHYGYFIDVQSHLTGAGATYLPSYISNAKLELAPNLEGMHVMSVGYSYD